RDIFVSSIAGRDSRFECRDTRFRAGRREFGKLIEQQFAGLNKQFVVALDKFAESAPAGSEAGISALKSAIATGNAAYENISKAAKQFGDTAKTNLEAAAKRAAPVVKKTKK
ncbi:MAG TPA: hypothetical protein VK663_14645, partial [Burkholderiales bacterium]|nr:hypothetical protein [Burkholderiales bacterium]